MHLTVATRPISPVGRVDSIDTSAVVVPESTSYLQHRDMYSPSLRMHQPRRNSQAQSPEKLGKLVPRRNSCADTTSENLLVRQSLVSLYNATSGPEWSEQIDWTSELHYCQWYNVRCSPTCEVQELDLFDNSLKGTIPPEVGNLTALTHLDLSSNALSGTISPELSSLTAVTYFYLESNSLSGTISPDLSSLTAVMDLRLYSNSLSGTISSKLSSLSEVTQLYL